MDIAHDRAGYYLCWGCLVWVPAIYTSPALFLVEHPVRWGPAGAAAIALTGIAAIYINYDSDRQRQARRTNWHASREQSGKHFANAVSRGSDPVWLSATLCAGGRLASPPLASPTTPVMGAGFASGMALGGRCSGRAAGARACGASRRRS